jgi:hypothetical protein
LTGSAVLQKKAIPPRPTAYDGSLVLFDLPRVVSLTLMTASAENVRRLQRWALRARLQTLPIGTVQELELAADGATACVRFATHTEAENALAVLHERGHACDYEYNERAYDGKEGRGWCIAEQGASVAVATLLNAAEDARRRRGIAAWQGVGLERFDHAQRSRPKVVEIREDESSQPVEFLAKEEGGGVMSWLTGESSNSQLDAAIDAIDAAHFTGKGDKPAVRMLLAGLEYSIKTAIETAVASAAAPGELTLPPEHVPAWREFKRSWFRAAAPQLLNVSGQEVDKSEWRVDVELASVGGHQTNAAFL